MSVRPPIQARVLANSQSLLLERCVNDNNQSPARGTAVPPPDLPHCNLAVCPHARRTSIPAVAPRPS